MKVAGHQDGGKESNPKEYYTLKRFLKSPVKANTDL